MIQAFLNEPISLLIYLIAIIVAISIHEFAHAYTANYLGDPTPELQGRLTLHPKAHIDLYGILFLFLAGFGWGKPVEFDPFNLKNPRRDAAIISLAGPVSNLILAIVTAIILRLITYFFPLDWSSIGYFLLRPLITINVFLAFFNLLPIHPLDGFKIVGGFLSSEKASEWYSLSRYGLLFLLLLILPINGRSMLGLILTPLTAPLLQLLLPGRGII